MLDFVYHYTSYQALLNIINKNGLIFHASRFDSMNDPKDYIFARDIVIPKLEQSIKGLQLKDDQAEDVGVYPYVLSFSEKEDCEHMWESYKSKVCLKLSANKLNEYCIKGKEKRATWGKCKYVEDTEVPEAFIKLFNSFDQSNDILSTAREDCAFIKQKAWEEEKEWRLVQCCYDGFLGSPNEGIKECEIAGDTTNVKISNNGKLLLYTETLLQKEALLGITINENDKYSFSKTSKAIEILLQKYSYPMGIEIKQSNKYPI